MSGGSSAKSVSTPTNVALAMSFGATVEVTLEVKTVNTIVIESVSMIIVEADYDSISINNCIGSSILTHGPPMVDVRSFFRSITVFTVSLFNSYHNYHSNKFFKI